LHLSRSKFSDLFGLFVRGISHNSLGVGWRGVVVVWACGFCDLCCLILIRDVQIGCPGFSTFSNPLPPSFCFFFFPFFFFFFVCVPFCTPPYRSKNQLFPLWLSVIFLPPSISLLSPFESFEICSTLGRVKGVIVSKVGLCFARRLPFFFPGPPFVHYVVFWFFRST